MQTLFKSVSKFVLLSFLSLLVFNCSKEESTSEITENQVVTSTELQTILETDDLLSATDTVVTTLFQNGQSGKSAKIEDCYVAEFSDTGYTVSFDNCSLDGHDNISGSISVTYTIGSETTSFNTTYTNLSIGAYTINGTRNFNMNTGSESNVAFTIISDMTMAFEDGSVIEEAGTKTIEFVIDSENFENSAFTITGDWTIKRNGNTYIITVSTPLEYIFGCAYVGKGMMQVNKNGLAVDIDFGDGTCDDIATMTYPDGTIEEISLKD